MALDFPDSPTAGDEHLEGSIKWYFDGVKWGNSPGASSAYLPLAGGTMLGTLTLDGPPAAALDAATKAYADGMLPLTGGTLTGPLIGTDATFSGPLEAENGLFIGAEGTAQVANCVVNLHGDGTKNRAITGFTNNLARWGMVLGDVTPEPGDGSGSGFAIVRNDDAGVNISPPALAIDRLTGVTTFDGGFLRINGPHIEQSADSQGNCGAPGFAWWQVASYNFPLSSDARLKRDIVVASPGALANVAAIPVYQYHFRREDDTAPLHIGWLADEVQAALGPDSAVVVTGEDERKSLAVNLNEMVAVLWQAVQELSAKVMTLEGGPAREVTVNTVNVQPRSPPPRNGRKK